MAAAVGFECVVGYSFERGSERQKKKDQALKRDRKEIKKTQQKRGAMERKRERESDEAEESRRERRRRRGSIFSINIVREN